MSKNFNTTLKIAVALTMLASGVVSTAQSRGGRGRQGTHGTPPQRPPRVETPVQRPTRNPDSYAPDRQTRPAESFRPGRLEARSEDVTRIPRIQPPDRPARPRPMPRRRVFPTFYYWNVRYSDIFNDMRFMSRSGYIPVTAVPQDTCEIIDYAQLPAGWRGYGFVVPPGESVTINLEHPNRNWFRLIICDKWGQAVPGGLSSKLPQLEPRLTYTNPGSEAMAIYLIVDDPGWMSGEENPYTLEIDRSWEPDLITADQSLIVSGIWGISRSVNARFRGPVLVMPGFK